MPHLRGNTGVAERTIFWRSTRWGVQHAARQGSWKYVRRPEGEFLFDLSRDPQEKENLAGSQRQVVERLRGLYAEWEAGVLPPIEPL